MWQNLLNGLIFKLEIAIFTKRSFNTFEESFEAVMVETTEKRQNSKKQQRMTKWLFLLRRSSGTCKEGFKVVSAKQLGIGTKY